MKRVFLAAALALALVPTGGCGGGKQKVVARVNRDIITDEDFNYSTRRVTAFNLAPALEAPGHPGKAGEFALQNLIGEKLLTQFATEKHAIPSDAQLNSYIAFVKKYPNPRANLVPIDPYRDEEDTRREVKISLTYRNLAMGNVKWDPGELEKLYEQSKANLTPRDQYHIRIIDVKTQAKAKIALDALKKLPFETVALTQSEDPVTAPKNGDAGTIMDQQIPPPLLAALKDLKPGEYTKTIITASVPPWNSPPNAGVQPETRYFLVQLVEKISGRVPAFEEVKPLMENVAISRKDPTAFQRVQNNLQDFREKANIQINLKEYEPILARFRAKSVPGGARPAAGAAR